MRYYVDSCVIISYLKQEFGFRYQLQYTRVKEFFAKCHEEGHTIVLSNLTFKEVLKNAYTKENEIEKLFTELRIPYEKVVDSRDIQNKSIQIEREGVPYPDSKHVAFALFSNSDCIITWNIKDFFKACKHIPSLTPLDAI